MSKHEDELKKALSEDGNFDRERTARDAAEANSYFDSQLRRHARITYSYLIIVAAVLNFALVGFVLTFSIKALVGFAVLLLVTAIPLAVQPIWHEIKTTKISLLREIKLLRLERLGLPTEATEASTRLSARWSVSPWRAISRREGAAWVLVMLVVAGASCCVTLRLMTWGISMTDESRVTLLSDGSGTAVNKVSYRYQGFLPMTSASLYSGDPSYAIKQWVDCEGRDLPISVSTIDGHQRFTVQFVEPIMPGDRVSYTTTATRAKMATQDGGIWTYRGGQKWAGKGRNYSLETVRLPPGAQIVSVEPKPSQQVLEDGAQTLRFQAVVDQDHELSYTIQYRFPSSHTGP